MNITDVQHILITDVGSTTTKALLLSKNGARYNFSGIAKSPTTVEKPFEDVKIGLLRAVKSIETETSIELIRDNKISVPYLTTSSAGGGLQILVFGNSAIETGRIAQMTAYGAGGVILRTLTIDDQIMDVDKMRLIRELHPDLVLMAGGMDGGAMSGVVRLAELLTIADPDPKFGSSERIPLVFCGNKDARDYVINILEDKFDLHIVDNVRPDFNTLNLTPAREKIHDLFMENVMERAPGYDGLKKWVAADILPTPVGVEKIQKLYSEKLGKNVMIVDMGGATTDIFSNIAGDYYRTVAANIGMSYSVSNILKEAGIDRIMRHLPEDYSERDVRDYIANKTLNPTYVPTNNTENLVEHATAIEGLKVALRQHQEMNFRLAKLSRRDRLKKLPNSNQFEDVLITPADKFFQLSEIDLIIGAGGIFAHVESPAEAFWMLVEGFSPRGVVKLAIDSSFSIPHMGVFASIDPDSALELFIKECLVELGYIVAPTGKIKPGKRVLTVRDKNTGQHYEVSGGEFVYLARGGDLVITSHGNVRICQNKERYELKTSLPILFDCRGRDELTVKQAEMLDVPLSKAGISELTFEPGGFKPAIKSAAPGEIVEGTFEFERKLPYEGTITVKPGDVVEPTDLVGVNRYAPPKLYILDIIRATSYTPLTVDEIKRGILIEVGDEIKPGQELFKLAAKSILGETRYYTSPVRGRVSKIEPRGVILAREVQDYDGRPHVLDIARKLKIKPKHIKTYLKVKPGDYIEVDRVVAQRYEKVATASVTSPTTGTLKSIDTVKGSITIQYDLNPVVLKSFVSGVVSRVEDNHCAWIKGDKKTLAGIVGFGGEAWGELVITEKSDRLLETHRGMVAVSYLPIDETYLRKAEQHGLAGIIAPSIHNSDWVAFYGEEMGVALTGDEDIPFTMILTEGFGQIEMNETYRNFFEQASGRIASIAGRTQIRAGVTRPRIIVSN